MDISRLSAKAKAALFASVESSIDMYYDMAIDPMWLQVNEVRELATKSDEEIRQTIRDNANEANKNIDSLVELSILRAELIK